MRIHDIGDSEGELSRMVDEVRCGNDLVLVRHGTPVARITPLPERRRQITFGLLAGKVQLPDGFDAPLPPKWLPGFEGD